jgi:uncharacterized iron-regulated membrane protein
MNLTNNHLLFVLPVGLAVLVLGVVARLLWRRARAASRPIVIGRSGGSPLRTLLLAGLVIGVQWAVVAHDPTRVSC